jgi:hypothetical protein
MVEVGRQEGKRGETWRRGVWGGRRRRGRRTRSLTYTTRKSSLRTRAYRDVG